MTLLVIYALLNWLPSLPADRGITRVQAPAFAIALNGGAVLGSLLLGAAAHRLPRARMLTITYCGMASALAALAFASGEFIPLAVCTAGFAAIGGQLVLYALAPALYPLRTADRGSVPPSRLGGLGRSSVPPP